MLKQLPEVQASPELGTPQPVGTQPQTPLEEFTTVGHPHGSQAEGISGVLSLVLIER